MSMSGNRGAAVLQHLSTVEAERTVLQLCHLSGDTATLLKQLVSFFGALTGCQAIGIRVEREEDFPYYTTAGFPRAFVVAERSLCSRDAAGHVLRDETGNAVLECMCGNVIRGRVDSSKPFFSAHGSFWTNSTSALLASTTEADRQARTRNRCNGEGYESVALLPLRAHGRTFGLVQLNDPRPGRFSAEGIAVLEHLVDHAAIAVAKFEADEALKRSEEKYRIVADNTHDWEFWVGPQGEMYYMSPSCERVTGYPPSAFAADTELRRRIVAPEYLDVYDRHRHECHVGGVPGSAVYRIVRKDGSSRWIEHVCQPVRGEDGRLMGVRGSNRDVTDRKEAEDARLRAEAEREALIAQLKDALAHVKTLRGFVPICASCKKIRDDDGYWQAVEVYVREHTEAEFSHGLCPACMKRLYPEFTVDEPGV